MTCGVLAHDDPWPETVSSNADPAEGDCESPRDGAGDLGDLLQELRVLLQGVQVLTGFLIVLPFSEGFARVGPGHRRLYVVLFVCALVSLVLFSAPAAQHRILTPLSDRIRFKRGSTRLVVAGMVPFSVALVLATHFVLTHVAGTRVADVVSAVVAAAIFMLWWMIPLVRRRDVAHSASARDL